MLSTYSFISSIKLEKQAFGDVVPRFHTVNNIAIPVKFYEYINNENRLVINDNLFETFEKDDNTAFLSNELYSRWDLLEASFEIKRENSVQENNIRRIYLAKGHERRDITHTRPVLNGYQNGVCFYCGEKMNENDIHVDHVIPRQMVYHDEIWNLVLSHTFCNLQKNDSLPSINYIEKLIVRNEHFIINNHPIKNKLIDQLGKTPQQRRKYIMKVYEDAKL
ncbi:HNH endonuclease [Cytobacillus oceanisediminis]|uniref:HNH endonuclease n=1 Tax=Cytobacillus oceanisediminis TaxID=665099 RepID=UPI001FB4A2BE|nr:HNH endonuclease domain-containing protein [Cytobacillus oceanisediminis]